MILCNNVPLNGILSSDMAKKLHYLRLELGTILLFIVILKYHDN